MPRVTVLLSSFNHERFVAQAIDSVLAQTFQDFELILIDDCSADRSWEIVQAYRDPRIRAFRNPVRRRAAAGFNESVGQRAQGEYVAIHHSDDVFLPEKLRRQVDFLDAHPGVAAVFARAHVIDENGNRYPDRSHRYCTIFDQANRPRRAWLRSFFFDGNCLCHPSVLIRRECLMEAGLYDRRFGMFTDFDLWIRLCLRHEIHVMEEALLQYRVLADEANASGDRPVTHVRGQAEMVQVLRRFLAIPTAEELISVFPEAQRWLGEGDSHVPYVLARLALDNKNVAHQVFGISVLYELMGDPAVAAHLERVHGFTYPQLVELAGETDLFGVRRILDLQADLARMRASASWRITEPLRRLRSVLRAFRSR